MGEYLQDQSQETPEEFLVMDAYGQAVAVPSDDSWLFKNDAMRANPAECGASEEAI